jgi:hypothetical protein
MIEEIEFSFATQQKKPSQNLRLLWLRSKASEAKIKNCI